MHKILATPCLCTAIGHCASCGERKDAFKRETQKGIVTLSEESTSDETLGANREQGEED
jgi:hypothetical protein